MSTSLLHKRDEVAARKRELTLDALRERAAAQGCARGFQRALHRQVARQRLAVIAELKRASPSKGVLRENFDPLALARSYMRAGATCLSVLTDTHFFRSSGVVLDLVRMHCPLPALRKDFIIDEFQVYESRAYGADAILLIAAAVPTPRLKSLFELASSQGMDVLVEVHDAAELEAALTLGDDLKMIGINNRDLRTFDVDLRTTLRLIDQVPAGKLIVSESGIRTRTDIARLVDAGVYACLIGESLITAADPGAHFKRFARTMSARAMQVDVHWTAGVRFVAETGSGHSVCMDGAVEFGGRNLAARPMEMLLAGVGGCSGFDMVKTLRQHGQDLRAIALKVRGERAAATPAVFERIQIQFIVTGRHLNEELVRRTASASVEKYSSVSRMLEKSVQIMYDCTVVQVE